MSRRTFMAGAAAFAFLAGHGLQLSGPMVLPDAHAAGTAAVDVPMQDLEGRTRTLDDWSGMTRLVNFWATWCGPCRTEMPLFQDAHERLTGRNIRVIGVALDRAAAVSRFKEQLGITYPLVLIDARAGMDMMSRYGNTAGAVPYSILLSPQGDVLARHLGAFSESQLNEFLDRHLDDQSPATEMTRGAPARPADRLALRYRVVARHANTK